MTAHLDLIRSAHAGMVWPRLPGADGTTALAMQYQLGQTQWWPAAKIGEYQLRQFLPVLRHAVETVPYYRERFPVTPSGGLTPQRFAELPRLTRADVQGAGSSFLSERVP